jgi:hypothetical protein
MPIAKPRSKLNEAEFRRVSAELSRRLMPLFFKKPDGSRPISASNIPFNYDRDWQDLLLFHEYFQGENGMGLGASHQGWTSLIAKILQQSSG